ncbi:MAG: endonuclease MutS2 [Bacteroidota bacterium]
MRVYPKSADEKLGFDVLRDRLLAAMRSRLGEERLARIRPFRKLEPLRAELTRVAELQEVFRFDDPFPLHDVLDLRDVLRRAAPEDAYLDPEDLVATRLVLATLRLVQRYVETRRDQYPALAHTVSGITALPNLEKRIAEVVGEDGEVLDTASPELRRLRRAIQQVENKLQAALARALRDAIGQGYATEDQPTVRGGRMVIPVRAEAKRKVSGFVHDVSATGQTVYIEPAAVLDLNNEVRELEAEVRREIERILRQVTGALREHLDAMSTNGRVLAQLDLLQAKARLANELEAVVPQLNDEGRLHIKSGRNPVLQLRFQRVNAVKPDTDTPDRAVVPLELQLGHDFHTLVITGPNAGGKTVAMKTVGLLTLMLAYGLPIPVDPLSEMALMDRLIVDIGDEQSIDEDLSTFSSHVQNLKYMLQHATDRSLVLIDEAGTGTDPAEGGALAQAVLEDLTKRGTRTLVTTHHGTLKVFAYERDGVENGSMQFDQDTLSPTYRFQAGIPGSSYAFDIATRIGLQRVVLKRARALMGEQRASMEALIGSLEARTQQAEEAAAEAERLRREADQTRQAFEKRRLKLERERDEVRQKALAEAEQIVKGANARVERTIREIKEAQAAREATQVAREKLDRFKTEVKQRKKKTERRRQQQENRLRKVAPSEARPARPTPKAPGPIQVGDQVVLDNGATAGEVLEIDGKDAMVAFGSLRSRVKLRRLTKVGGKKAQQVQVKAVKAADGGVPAMHARTNIDLRGQRVDEALAEVQRFVDEGLSANLDRLEILHGKGTGALREAIWEYLATRRDVARYTEAPIDQGGAGITVVSLG